MIISFTIPQEGRDHWRLVQKPVADSLDHLRDRGVEGRFTPELLRLTLFYLFTALDFLHSHYKIVYTVQSTRAPRQSGLTELAIKLDNLFVENCDDSIFDGFIQGEMNNPKCPSD